MNHPSRFRFLAFLGLACVLGVFSTGVMAELASQDAESSQAPEDAPWSGPADDAIPERIVATGNHLLDEFVLSGVVFELQPRLQETAIIALLAPRSPPR